MVFWTKLDVDGRIGSLASRKSPDIRVIINKLLIKEMTIWFPFCLVYAYWISYLRKLLCSLSNKALTIRQHYCRLYMYTIEGEISPSYRLFYPISSWDRTSNYHRTPSTKLYWCKWSATNALYAAFLRTSNHVHEIKKASVLSSYLETLYVIFAEDYRFLKTALFQ